MKRIILIIMVIIAFAGCVKAPVNLKIEKISTTSVKIGWEKSQWADKYKVYRSETENGEYKEIYSTVENTYEDMGLRKGERYFYKVTAVAPSNIKESEMTLPVEAATELLTPSNLKASSASSRVFIDWYGANDVEGYKIFRSESEKQDFSQIADIKGNSFEDTGVQSAKIYYYKIKAYKGFSMSAFSETVNVKSGMGAPRNLKVLQNGTQSLILEWESVDGAERYYIYRSRNDNGNFEEVSSVEKTRFEDRNLIPGRIYYYRVKAEGKGVESALCEAQFQTTKISSPQNIKVLQVSQDTIAFTWEPVDMADGYKIFRKEKESGGYKEIDFATDTMYTDKGIEANTDYFYRVRAYSGKLESDDSEEKKITTSLQVMTLKMLKSGMTDIKFGWNKMAGVKKYTVFRSEKPNSDYYEIGVTENNTFDDKDLSPYKNYYYRVKGYKGELEINSTILVVKSIDGGKKDPEPDTSKVIKDEASKNYQVNCVAASHTESIAAGGNSDNTIKIWNTNTGELLRTIRAHSNDVLALDFSPDGSIFASGSADGTIKLWNAATGEVMRTLKGHSEKVTCVVFANDQRLIVSGSADRSVRVWDTYSGKELKSFKGHEGTVNGVAVFPDNDKIVSVSSDKTVRIWSLDTGKMIRSMVDKYMVGGKPLEKYNVGEVTSVAVDSQGKKIITGNSDYKVKIWNAATGEMMAILKGHTDSVSAVGFNAKGTIGVSSSWDKSVKIWDLSDEKPAAWREMAHSEFLNGHNEFVTGVALNGDGSAVLTSSRDKTIKIWDIATGKIIKTLEEK